jgi:hypothetical protein
MREHEMFSPLQENGGGGEHIVSVWKKKKSRCVHSRQHVFFHKPCSLRKVSIFSPLAYFSLLSICHPLFISLTLEISLVSLFNSL